MRLGLRLARRNPESVLFGQYDFAKLGKRSRPLDGREREPLLDHLGVA
jgi:hypothetical protein